MSTINGFAAFSFITLLLVTGRPVSAGSAIIGNGGSTVFCSLAGDNGLLKEYSLDYVVESQRQNFVLANVLSVEDSLDRISKLLIANRYTLPYLRFLFDSFRFDVNNTTNDGRYNFWEPHPEGLANTNDQRLTDQLPEGCLDHGVPRIQQAFQRYGSRYTGQGTETTVYRFVPTIIERLKARPLQLSFLLVHEWLWNVSGDVRVNRRINYFLHSKDAASMDHNQIRTELEKMGLDFSRIGLFPADRKIQSYAFMSQEGTGQDRSSSCLRPRQEYATQKKWIAEHTCIQNNSTSTLDSHRRVVTINYDEKVVGWVDGSTRCRISGTFVCVASPQ